MMDVHQTYCENHFMKYVSQISILYTLNLYSAVWQLHLNKTGKKKKKIFLQLAFGESLTQKFLEESQTQ